MSDWVSDHRASISFVVTVVAGVLLIYYGALHRQDQEFILIGLGCIGAPGYFAAANHRKPPDASP